MSKLYDDKLCDDKLCGQVAVGVEQVDDKVCE